jgi:two-component system cell cycle sensor histidine kinase/response regulator CckA
MDDDSLLHGDKAVPPAPAPLPRAGETGELKLATLRRQRVQAQLEHQTAQNRELQRHSRIQATLLELMRCLTEVLGQPTNVTEVIGEVLVGCLDAAGLSAGLLYLVEAENRYRLHAHCGISAGMLEDAEACFGHPELIHAIAGTCQPAALALPGAAGAAADAADGATAGRQDRSAEAGGAAADFLTRLGRAYALVVPFVVMGKTFGVLVLASDDQEFSQDPSWLGFARTLAVQFGQTVALGQSLNRVVASEERYRALMDQAGDAILVLDVEQRILEANHAALRLLGRPREEIVGRRYDDFVAPEELAESRRNRESLTFDRSVRVPLRHLLRANGSRVAVEVSTTLVRMGEDSIVLAILRDITERRSLEAQFQQAQKMESVGRLAGGVAHDFNNLLTLILGYGNLVLHAVADRPAVSCQVEAIVHAGESAAILTRQLLAFSRRQVLVTTVVDVNALVIQLKEMLQRLIGEDIELVTDLEPRLARIRADAGQIEQVLMNLVINARDAMPGGGRLTVSTRNHPPLPPVVSGAAVAGDAPAVESGVGATHVVLQVTDTGSGIDSAVMAHLFEPFFTTKEEGKGTGLGLATVYGIVQQSGGRVEVDSQPGAGATFTVHLPSTDEPTAPLTGAGATAPAAGNETVLVAEDEALIRALVRTILEKQGYVILEAAGADEALRLAESHAGPIHLLLTDVIMLGKSGIELAAALAARRPGLRVIYMSGYTDRAMEIDTPGVVFLQKPLDTRRLAHHVRAALDRR